MVLLSGPQYCTDYWSPGGVELTLLAGTLAGLDRDTTVLDIGCGSGCASINLAKRFGCRCVAIDSEAEYVELARQNVGRCGVMALVSVEQRRIEDLASQASFHMVVAEGGATSVTQRYFASFADCSGQMASSP
jgi:cyclopropane fatty-acyl-phospholipid synthase-like methyltransferase